MLYREYNAATGEYTERPYTEEEVLELELTKPVETVELKTKIYKSTFIMRCEEEEIIQLLDRLATENVKFREMYNACDFFLTTDSMYAVLHWTVADELGEERANELLEPEE